ncbi:hypothetical protein FRX31_003273 [Thalictrum thalictroides]|uniref:Uncharacterized protein n=1 Tax=Thalictrum thalictroides TaxID=46969 RepID=A0A7J6XFH9_THATH|nr:hypothetical protein FRX31_003273 [Thalictrum thalictroides]
MQNQPKTRKMEMVLLLLNFKVTGMIPIQLRQVQNFQQTLKKIHLAWQPVFASLASIEPVEVWSHSLELSRLKHSNKNFSLIPKVQQNKSPWHIPKTMAGFDIIYV